MSLKDCIITHLRLWWAIRCCTASAKGRAHLTMVRLRRIGDVSKSIQRLLVCKGSVGSAPRSRLSSTFWSARLRRIRNMSKALPCLVIFQGSGGPASCSRDLPFSGLPSRPQKGPHHHRQLAAICDQCFGCVCPIIVVLLRNPSLF